MFQSWPVCEEDSRTPEGRSHMLTNIRFCFLECLNQKPSLHAERLWSVFLSRGGFGLYKQNAKVLMAVLYGHSEEKIKPCCNREVMNEQG